MPAEDFKEQVELGSKRHRENFSNYENAVTLICSLEAWFEYRWGPEGMAHAGLLDSFNRFPNVDDLTPDFEVRFHTPYIMWGDHKRTIQPAGSGRDDAIEQILKYAARRPSAVRRAAAVSDGQQESPPPPPIIPNYDVVVLVSSENDDVAAEAINVARQARMDQAPAEGKQPAQLAPIIVLGCHRDRESINGEWYKIKWRNHYGNHRFSRPNISPNSGVKDLNALIVAASHHAIPVNKPSLDLSGRNPFVNDPPPAIYTAIRLVIPAINCLLSDEDRDDLQSTGRVDKTLARADLLGVEIVKSMNPQPVGLAKWIEAGLDFLAELNWARKVPSTDPQQYVVTIDNTLIKGDPRELFSDRAAKKAAKSATKGVGPRRFRGDHPDQMRMFEGE